jgi:hypothetical protein
MGIDAITLGGRLDFAASEMRVAGGAEKYHVGNHTLDRLMRTHPEFVGRSFSSKIVRQGTPGTDFLTAFDGDTLIGTFE